MRRLFRRLPYGWWIPTLAYVIIVFGLWFGIMFALWLIGSFVHLAWQPMPWSSQAGRGTMVVALGLSVYLVWRSTDEL